MRETPGADSYSLHALREQVDECLSEGIEPPDVDEELARWDEEGWKPLEPLHADLLAFERMRKAVGDPHGWEATSPNMEWPYGRTLLAAARTEIARHGKELEAMRLEERRSVRGAR